MWRCDRCQELRYDAVNKCNSKEFTVIHDGDESKYWAMDAEGAALKFAQEYNEGGDYSLMDKTIEVIVRTEDGVEAFDVSAEADINYSASAKEVENG